MSKVDLVLGDIPRGANYFGRADFIAELRRALETSHVLITGPRRFGKSGAIFHLRDHPPAGLEPIYLSVEDRYSAGDFMVDLVAHLLESKGVGGSVRGILRWMGAGTKSILGRLEEVSLGELKVRLRDEERVAARWLEFADQLFEKLPSLQPAPLLMLDEFPVFIEHMLHRDAEEGARFLHWFRRLRQHPADRRARFVLSGSTSLHHVLERHGLMATINDLRVLPMTPWTEVTARDFVEAIFRGRAVELDLAVRERILTETGVPIPFFLARVLSAVFQRAEGSGVPITADLVTRAIQEDILSGPTDAAFGDLRQRLVRYYGDRGARVAKHLLTMLARAPGAVERSLLYHEYVRLEAAVPDEATKEQFLDLMSRLEHDFYIRRTGDSYEFWSRLLKSWWFSKYGFEAN